MDRAIASSFSTRSAAASSSDVARFGVLPDAYFEDRPSTIVKAVLDDPAWGIPDAAT